MSSLFSFLSGQIASLWKQLREEGGELGVLPLLQPISPYAGPPLLTPLSAVGVLLGLVVASGVAVAALGVLLVALLALYFLVTEVLGITIEVKPLGG